jgi:hypothetical protein
VTAAAMSAKGLNSGCVSLAVASVAFDGGLRELGSRHLVKTRSFGTLEALFEDGRAPSSDPIISFPVLPTPGRMETVVVSFLHDRT